MISTLISCILGSLIGTITGITPGIHVNLAATLVVASTSALSPFFTPLDLCILIVTMATVHTFLDVVPSVFLGAPSEAFATAALPGHRMLLCGAGYEAVRIATAGAVASAIVAVLISPLLWSAVPIIAEAVAPWMAWLLIVVTLGLCIRETGFSRKLCAVFFVCASGALGLVTLQKIEIADPLLPLLSGLFGASTLVMSLGESSVIPLQFVTEHHTISGFKQAVLVACAVSSGWIVSVLPGVGTAQAAILSTALLPSLAPTEYLFLVGGIGTVNFVLSIISLATIGKARNGAIAAILELTPTVDTHHALMLMSAALAAAGIGALLALLCARIATRAMRMVPYHATCLIVFCIVTLAVVMRTGLTGSLVYLTSTALGVMAVSLGAARIHLMACLTIPVIINLWR